MDDRSSRGGVEIIEGRGDFLSKRVKVANGRGGVGRMEGGSETEQGGVANGLKESECQSVLSHDCVMARRDTYRQLSKLRSNFGSNLSEQVRIIRQLRVLIFLLAILCSSLADISTLAPSKVIVSVHLPLRTKHLLSRASILSIQIAHHDLPLPDSQQQGELQAQPRPHPRQVLRQPRQTLNDHVVPLPRPLDLRVQHLLLRLRQVLLQRHETLLVRIDSLGEHLGRRRGRGSRRRSGVIEEEGLGEEGEEGGKGGESRVDVGLEFRGGRVGPEGEADDVGDGSAEDDDQDSGEEFAKAAFFDDDDREDDKGHRAAGL
jgi:hypothetical protein